MATTIPMEQVHRSGAVVEERSPATSTTTEEIIPTTNASHPSSIPTSASASSPDSASTSPQVQEPTSPPPTQQASTASNPTPNETIAPLVIPGNEPPAYSLAPLPPSPTIPRSRSPSPPPPPLPPSPVISPVRTLPPTRPLSFPLQSNASIPSCTPRPYTFHPPPTLPPRHSIAIDIFPDPDPDTNPPPNEEPLPTYSRYPKRGEAHCMGEIGSPDARSEISEPPWDGHSQQTKKSICCCGMYMRTVIAGIVVLVVACVIAGGVVGWQMKANFENVPNSGPQSTPINNTEDGGVNYWTAPGNSVVSHTTLSTSAMVTSTSTLGGHGKDVIVQPTATATATSTPTQSMLLLTVRMPGPIQTPTVG